MCAYKATMSGQAPVVINLSRMKFKAISGSSLTFRAKQGRGGGSAYVPCWSLLRGLCGAFHFAF